VHEKKELEALTQEEEEMELGAVVNGQRRSGELRQEQEFERTNKKEIDSDGHDDPESIDNRKVPQEASSGQLQEWYCTTKGYHGACGTKNNKKESLLYSIARQTRQRKQQVRNEPAKQIIGGGRQCSRQATKERVRSEWLSHWIAGVDGRHDSRNKITMRINRRQPGKQTPRPLRRW
jgi:hypothetical protein